MRESIGDVCWTEWESGGLEVICRGGVDWDRCGDPTVLMLEVVWIGKDLNVSKGAEGFEGQKRGCCG